MTKEEYIKRMNEEDDWAPGWDAIEEEFEFIVKLKEKLKGRKSTN